MPFLNFGGNKNKHFNLSDMNFFMKNMKNRYSDPDPLLRKGGSEDQDPDQLFPNVDPRIRIRIHVKVRWIRNAAPNKSFTFLIRQTFLGEKPKNACPEYELSSLILSLQGP